MEQQTGAGAVLAGRYRLVEPIGRGGMGKVWRAHDELLHRTVAVKELTAGLYVAQADRDVLHARTQKEARAAARIQHPAVVTVHDVLEHDDRPWIVMEYIDGPSLADAAKTAGRIEPREAARIGLHVLGALRAAHAVGVLHRDVKPGNVMLAKDGRVMLTDFGIAAIEGDSSITRTGELIGSIDYLAPERVTGGSPDPASDLWSLGATLYTAVEARSPFRRTSPIESLQAVVNEEPPAPAHAGALAPVITALLRKDPAQRPSADEAEQMLVQAMEGREPKSAQAYVPTRAMGSEELGAARNEPADTTELPGEGERGRAPEPGPEPVLVTRSEAGPVRQGGRDTGAAGRIRRAAAVAVVAALLGGGGVFGILKYTSDSKTDGAIPGRTAGSPDTLAGGASGTSSGGSAGASAGAGDGKGQTEKTPPAGWRKVVDKEGFSLFVPDGWKRREDGTQIDYTRDDGKHFIRIAVDRAPTFKDPYAHLLDLEKQVQKRSDYVRLTLHPNTFRGQVKAALWEFVWTEKTGAFTGPRKAVEQMYYAPDGTEYAVYMSGPVADWDVTREQFDIVLSGWQPAPAA
ncbi:serine/threonine-protein kinase [Streptomyces sp. NBC_01264]|uniref:serine/threonine-protein kinase n=1 Tax=Streptomyces sp. NBC_01264 TaxID=2903804 RepID=UPI00225B9FA3|nr:serine/threonine-protein kinase [Streptomyces sp. NBC_01264]MCX4780514.1 protein kinase [Streptomyces sp. NBC_01264]